MHMRSWHWKEYQLDHCGSQPISEYASVRPFAAFVERLQALEVCKAGARLRAACWAVSSRQGIECIWPPLLKARCMPCRSHVRKMLSLQHARSGCRLLKPHSRTLQRAPPPAKQPCQRSSGGGPAVAVSDCSKLDTFE